MTMPDTLNVPVNFFNRHLQRLNDNSDTTSFQTEIFSGSPYPPEKESRKIFNYRLFWLLTSVAVAAAIVALLFFFKSFPVLHVNSNQYTAQNTVTTRKGSKSNIQLPDGTMVWLNADSKLTYDDNFRGEIRNVHLQGEAFFEVARDEQRPFIIHTKTIDIRVLGTVFNVKAYETESNTETSLIKGSVEVSFHNNSGKKIILKPYEKLKVDNKSLAYRTVAEGEVVPQEKQEINMVIGKIHYEKNDSMALEALWVRNKLVFDAESLEEVMRKIERWYNVKTIITVDEKSKATPYSAIFDNENLMQVMEALKTTGGFDYAIQKDVVFIK